MAKDIRESVKKLQRRKCGYLYKITRPYWATIQHLWLIVAFSFGCVWYGLLAVVCPCQWLIKYLMESASEAACERQLSDWLLRR